MSEAGSGLFYADTFLTVFALVIFLFVIFASCRCSACRLVSYLMSLRYFHFLYGGFLCTAFIAKNFMTCIAGPVLLSSILCTRFFNSRMICQLMSGCCYGHCVFCRFSCSGFVSEQGAASSTFPMLMLSCFRTARRFPCCSVSSCGNFGISRVLTAAPHP